MPNTSFTPQEIEQFLQQFFDVVGARQYIGARYVPIFGRAGSDTVEWDDLAPYEPLTVVMHDGISYVSRRYVPAGIEISDTDYWVETYRFNAQVEQYRQEVLGFQDQIDTISQTMENDYVPFPDPLHYPKLGTLGQVLSTLADGTTKWDDPVVPSDEQAEEVITAWLDDHPEATTTVQDGSLTYPKFSTSLANMLLKFNTQLATSANYQSVLPTLADSIPNTCYFLVMTEADHQTDYPTGCGYKSYLLITIGMASVQQQYVLPLTFNDPTSYYAVRRYYSGYWHDWEYRQAATVLPGTVGSEQLTTDLFEQIQKFDTRNISWNNYQAQLPTLADAPLNSAIFITMTAEDHQPDYPVQVGYRSYLLLTIGKETIRQQYIVPLLLDDTDQYWALRRYYTNTWHTWSYRQVGKPMPASVSRAALDATLKAEVRQKITIGATGDYTGLCEGLAAAYTIGNCDVTIEAGTYDIANELIALHGNDYFASESFTDRGPLYGNGCKYYFTAGSFINCVLPANASLEAQRIFSPITAGIGDFEIVGAQVYSEFCRYSVHDELNGQGTYHHIYRDCHLHHNDTGNGYAQCFGGGLGEHGLIDIEGCTFESDTVEANDRDIVSFHNGNNANALSFIHITNCYFINGYARFSWYGPSTQTSEMYLSNCSFKNAIITETGEQGSTNVNTKAYQWNNVIRGS